MRARRSLAARGFAVVPIGVDHDQPQRPVEEFIARLGLSPHVPDLYRCADRAELARPVVAITADPATAATGHMSFGSTGPAPLHTDGTLEPLGAVRTSLLHCHRAAAEGGESIIFQLAAAVRHLQHEDPEAAATLFAPTVLRRHSTINGVAASHTDAVAAERAGRLAVRFSHAPADEWVAPRGSQAAFGRARAHLAEMAAAGSPWVARLVLAPGELLLLANDRVAHGRGPYRDDPAAPRCMFRALLLEDLNA